MKLKDITKQTDNPQQQPPRIQKRKKARSGLPPYLDKEAYEERKKEAIRKMRERLKEKKRERRERKKTMEKERESAQQHPASVSPLKDRRRHARLIGPPGDMD